MARTLPWQKKPPARAPGSAKRSTPARQRRPLPIDSSDVEDDVLAREASLRKSGFGERELSTSSPVETPEECFMEIGLDRDDRYRMVEDEFLEAAKMFTQHLHAAEYQRMKRDAKSRNADAIRTISRPVTMKMSDMTRKKVENVARSRKQADAISGLLGRREKAAIGGAVSDEEQSAWLGTTLHGLMDSPRNIAARLPKAGGSAAATRAAAGFQKPRPQTEKTRYLQPPTHSQLPGGHSRNDKDDDTISSDDDDDLDGPQAPTQARPRFERKSPVVTLTAGRRDLGSQQASRKHVQQGMPNRAAQDIPTRGVSVVESRDSYEESKASRDHEKASAASGRIARRIELARANRLKQEEKEAKALEVIPTFF